MDRSEDPSNVADEFLREGVHEFVPAIRALNAFIHEVEIRLRACLKNHDADLTQLGIVSSKGKLSISPNLGQAQPHLLRIGITSVDRWSFYIQLDPDKPPTRSMYVGFWLWTPARNDRQELYRLLHPIWSTCNFETEMADNQTTYVGRYVSQEEQFPAFQATMDGVIRHVIAGLKEINFNEKFGAGFQKQRPQSPTQEPNTGLSPK